MALYSNITDTGILSRLKEIAAPKVIYDLGSWDGGDAIALSEAFPEAAVVSVEGSPLRYPIVKKNCKRHLSIKCIQAVVTATDGDTVTMQHSETDGEPHCGTIKQFNLAEFAKKIGPDSRWKQISSFEVKTKSITTLISETGLGCPELIHMDIEGCEYEVLQCMLSAGHYPKYISLEVVGSEWFVEAKPKAELAWLLRQYQYEMIKDAYSDQLWGRR